jgi:dihydropyrimidine dehydrogenase (NAD+) subunit PreA
MRNPLAIEFCGIPCENPFFLSSSIVAGNYEMCARALEMGWGGIVFKTIGFFIPSEVSPRFDVIGKESTPFMGFKNLEMISDKPLEENLEVLARLKKNYPEKIIIASIMGENEEEWTKLAKMVTEAGVDIIECNFSCPQMTTESMGSDVGQNPELVKAYCEATAKGTHLPILAKMTPNIGNMEIPALASMQGGASGIAAINTVKSITRIDKDNLCGFPDIGGKTAVSGYSGKAIKPIALRFIHDLAKYPPLKDVPLSGMGGIETWEDALEFLLLGCTNIQITTAVMQYGYRIIEDLISGTLYYLEEKGYESVEEVIGLGLAQFAGANDLDRDTMVYPKFDRDKCIGCGRCYISCQDAGHQALEWSRSPRRPLLSYEKCVGCHLCKFVCPVQAISEEERIPKKHTI